MGNRRVDCRALRQTRRIVRNDDLGLGLPSAQSRPADPDRPPRAWPSERFVLTLWAIVTVAVVVAFLASRSLA